MAKTTIPTSDPIIREAIAFYILFNRLGFKRHQVEVFQFPNKPRPSQKVPVAMQIRFANQCGICLTHGTASAIMPLGMLIDCKYEVFKGRFNEAAMGIDEAMISPLQIQALLEGSHTFTRVNDLVLFLMQQGMIKDEHTPDRIKIIDSQIKKGNLIEIAIPGGKDTNVKN